MLRRQVSGSFVCLSCRLQLRGQAGFQRRPFALSARARNPDSPDADTQRIIDAIAGTNREDVRPDKPHAAPMTRRPRKHDSFQLHDAEPNEPKQSQEPIANGPQIQKYAYEKIRLADGTLPLDADNDMVRNRGQRFRIGGADLPIDILGKPGAAIVMRSRGNARRFVPPEPVVGEDAESSTDITEALEMALDAEEEDSLLNIHELRQTDRTLTEVEFNALGDTLLKGFTKAQLEEYLADSESFPREPVKEEAPQVPDPEWVVSRKPWIPDPVEGARERGDIMRGYISKSMSPKQRLVAEILRKRWNISCDSVSGNMGRLEVALRDVEFGLLLLGTKKWLRDITRNYLDTGSQIELIVARNTVSIRAPRTRSEVILQAINNVLSKSKTRTLDADLISPEPIDPGLLEDVGRLTNSIVRSSGRQILVTWVNLPAPAQGLEDLADVVYRYLISAFNSQLRSSSAVKILPREEAAGGRYIPNFACQPQLPWHERRKQWARWVVPSPARGEEKAKKPIKPRTIPSNFLPHQIEIKPDRGVKEPTPYPPPFSRDPFLPPPSQPPSQPMVIRPHHRHPGHLRPSSPRPTTTPSLALLSANRLPKPRHLSPTILRAHPPPLTAFGFPSNIHEEGLWHSILVLHFLPSPSSPDAPPLELRVEADHAELKRIVSLRAVTSHFDGDILFPAAPVDLRLRQDRYYQLRGDGIDVHAPAILEFMKAADLRPWAGKLATPPNLEGLMLPRRILGMSPSSSSSSEDAEAKLDAVQESVEESDVAAPELEQDIVQETVEERASPVTEVEEAIDEALAEEVFAPDAAAEETPSPVTEAEEAVAQVPAEEVSIPDVAAEQDITQELAEEEASPVTEGEETIAEEVIVEEVIAEEVISEEVITEHLEEEEALTPDVAAEELTSPVHPIEQEATHDTAPDTTSTEEPASPDVSTEESPHETAPSAPSSEQPPTPHHPPATPEPDLVPVSYRFAGIDIQRVVTANYEGLRLSYRSIEAGQRGGKRSELVLRAAAASKEPTDFEDPRKPANAGNKVDAATFLHIASRLTTKVEGGGPSGSEVFSWHGAKDRADGDDGYLYVR